MQRGNVTYILYMSVELEQLALYGLFHRKGRTYAILERDFGYLVALAAELTPILIDPAKLWRLGFSRVFTKGMCVKEYNGIRLGLSPGKRNDWIIQFAGLENAGHVRYIHEVQRLWFAHFSEHLWMPSHPPAPLTVVVAKPAKPSNGIVVTLKPDNCSLVVPAVKLYLALPIAGAPVRPMAKDGPEQYRLYEYISVHYEFIGQMTKDSITLLLDERGHRWDMVQTVSGFGGQVFNTA